MDWAAAAIWAAVPSTVETSENTRTFESAALPGGLVREGILTCPGHFWRYDLRTGQCINRPDRIASYPCRVIDGWVDVLVTDPAPVLGMRAMLLAAARPDPPPRRV